MTETEEMKENKNENNREVINNAGQNKHEQTNPF